MKELGRNTTEQRDRREQMDESEQEMETERTMTEAEKLKEKIDSALEHHYIFIRTAATKAPLIALR